ncbi:MAG TPA: imidazoleglycerol-phosphate dehydratase, partial [Casimicrobiaceae bacterium]|nr:imidazoleglycerol-phosphate dehydratase [Casimicrobiaceae bacterium]
MNAPSSPARTARVERRTRETRIAVELDFDGSGRADLASGIPFL